MIPTLALLTTSVILLGITATNEISHGAVAGTVGFGHNHMADYGGYHCSGPDDAEAWMNHVEHVHHNDVTPQDHCDPTHMDRDRRHVGAGADGPMGPNHAGGMA